MPWEVDVRLNGEGHQVSDGCSVAQLLDELGLAGRKVAVELNRDILAREDYSTRRLAAGDVVEVVQFVGGG